MSKVTPCAVTVTAREIEAARDTASEQLQAFLQELGYDVHGCRR